MRKLAKYLGIILLIFIGFSVNSYVFNKTTNQPILTSYLDTDGLTEKQKVNYVNEIPISFAHSSAYGGKFLYPINFTTSLQTIIAKAKSFSEVTYLISVKRHSLSEVGYMAKKIIETPPRLRRNLYIYGNVPKINAHLRANFPTVPIYQNLANVFCRDAYFYLGWTSYIPSNCRNTAYFIGEPSFIWGWKNNFIHMMASINTQVFDKDTFFDSSKSTQEIIQALADNDGYSLWDPSEELNLNYKIRDKWRANH